MATEDVLMMATLPDGYTARPARGDEAEAEAVLGLIRACDLAETGETDDWTVQDILDDWRSLGDVTSGTLLIGAPEGQLAGYGEIHSHGAGRLDADVYIHPNHRGRGLGTFMTHELEARARRLLGEHPAGIRVVLGTGINRGNEEARRLLEIEGFHEARQVWRMARGVHAENHTAATRLYEGAGMRVAAHYTVYQKELRSGAQAAAAPAR